jgi:hypothetical protein
MSVHTAIGLIHDLQLKIRHLNSEVRDAKVELFKTLLSEMGPQNVIASGAVSINLSRVTQIFR